MVLEDGETADEGSTPVPELITANEDTGALVETIGVDKTTTLPELTIGDDDTTTGLEIGLVPLEIGVLETPVVEGVAVRVELAPV